MMRKGENVNVKILICVCAFLGILVYVLQYGVYRLNPFNVEWIYYTGTDSIQTYLGWEYWRQESLTWPLGVIKRVCYPGSTTIVYTDSIPLFAFLFKPLTFFSSKPFQYIGLWICFCSVMNSILGGLIIYRYVKNVWYSSLCSVFYATASAFIHRSFGHNALAGQWVILLAVVLLLWENKCKFSQKKQVVLWTVCCIISIMIHPYIFAMTCAILAIDLIRKLLRKQIPFAVIQLITAMLCSFFIFWIEGGIWNMDSSKDGGNLGQASFNILGFFISATQNVFGLPTIPRANIYFPDEGFQYLGASIILLLPVMIIYFIYKFLKAPNKKYIMLYNVFPVGIIALILFVLALSPQIWIGNKLVVEYSVPKWLGSIWGVFQGTGRLMWPVFYAIISMVLISVGQIILECKSIQLKKVLWFVTPIFLFVAQYFIDEGGIVKSKHEQQENIFQSSRLNPMNSSFWNDALDDVEIVEYVMAWNMSHLQELQAKCLNKDTKLSEIYCARLSMDDMNEIAYADYINLLNGVIDTSKLYIFTYTPFAEQVQQYYRNDDRFLLLVVDGFLVGVSKDAINNELPEDVIDAKKINIRDYGLATTTD